MHCGPMAGMGVRLASVGALVLLGLTAEKTLRQALCDVLEVR